MGSNTRRNTIRTIIGQGSRLVIQGAYFTLIARSLHKSLRAKMRE